MRKPPLVHVTMTLDIGSAQKIRALATEKTTSVSGLVRYLIRQAWAEHHDAVNRQLEDA